MATQNGLEPSTSSVTGWRSKPTELLGHMLPTNTGLYKTTRRLIADKMAGAEGFEPSARGFGDRCSTS